MATRTIKRKKLGIKSTKNKYSATDRQANTKELIDNLPSRFFTYSREWNELNNPYPHEHYDDWRGYKPFTEYTIGGKFLNTLIKIQLLDSYIEVGPNRQHRRNQDLHYLYEKLAVAPDGYVYIGPKDNLQVMKLDIPPSVSLASKLK